MQPRKKSYLRMGLCDLPNERRCLPCILSKLGAQLLRIVHAGQDLLVDVLDDISLCLLFLRAFLMKCLAD